MQVGVIFIVYAGKRWRMDKSVQEATAERQMQAIAMLDKPYAFLEEQENLQLRKFAINPNADEAQQQVGLSLYYGGSSELVILHDRSFPMHLP